jgi:hypothetical protein
MCTKKLILLYQENQNVEIPLDEKLKNEISSGIVGKPIIWVPNGINHDAIKKNYLHFSVEIQDVLSHPGIDYGLFFSILGVKIESCHHETIIMIVNKNQLQFFYQKFDFKQKYEVYPVEIVSTLFTTPSTYSESLLLLAEGSLS